MKRILLLVAIIILSHLSSFSQDNDTDTLKFTLKEVIDLAQKQSPDITRARHYFRTRYWSNVYHKANYLPSLNFSSNPYLNRAINLVPLGDGTSKYVRQNMLDIDANLFIQQNIAFTGGTLSLITNLERLDMLDMKEVSYRSSPLILSYRQSLLGFNALKWDRNIEPMRFEQAKKNYVEDLEYIAQRAVDKFFNLMSAQSNYQTAGVNYESAKTRYNFAQGRYEIGSMTENEMLQLEINMFSAENSRMNYFLSLDDYMQDLRSFLGIKTSQPIEVIVDEQIPLKEVDQVRALTFALKNSSQILAMELSKKERDMEVARAKGESGLNADLTLRVGLTNTGKDIPAVYKDPSTEQAIMVGISFPILDWGRSKGRVQLAKSNRDMVYMEVEQQRNDFEMNVQKTIKQFNVQPGQIELATKVDQIAQRRYDVTQRSYLLGRVAILDLNDSVNEKDGARRSYISALHNYWALYYTLRRLTLYDFEKDIPITEDYQLLIK